MKYRSTRNKSFLGCSASQAIRQGLAEDGGLYVPEAWPSRSIDLDICTQGADKKFSVFAARVLAPFFRGDILEPYIPEICERAFQFQIPLRELNSQVSVLELFCGPTCAFKDFGARFLALCLEKLSSLESGSDSRPNMVLVATSGDTGGAVAAAFSEFTKIPVAILFPKGRISKRQEAQLTGWGPQVQAFAVEGSFDDCQRIVKEAFRSEAWQSRFQLISANSINLGRLLPQMAFFAYASCLAKARHQTSTGFIIPSGNLGNAVAALWAQQLGFPIREIVFAHNANQTVPIFFASGVWQPAVTQSTLANAMDVGIPSNFERVLDLFPKLEDLRERASAISVSDEEINETIRQGPTQWGQVWCPHTATAVFVVNKHLGIGKEVNGIVGHSKAGRHKQNSENTWVVVATAHPAKFESIVEPLVGRKIEVPASLQALLEKPSQVQIIGPSLECLSEYLLKVSDVV